MGVRRGLGFDLLVEGMLGARVVGGSAETVVGAVVVLGAGGRETADVQPTSSPATQRAIIGRRMPRSFQPGNAV